MHSVLRVRVTARKWQWAQPTDQVRLPIPLRELLLLEIRAKGPPPEEPDSPQAQVRANTFVCDNAFVREQAERGHAHAPPTSEGVAAEADWFAYPLKMRAAVEAAFHVRLDA